MSSQDDDQQSLVLWVVFGLVALVVSLMMVANIYQRSKMSSPKAGAAGQAALSVVTMASSSPMSPMSPTGISAADRQALSDAASVKVENGVVKFYFASGKTDLATGANDALTEAVKAAKAGKKLVISGYHDGTGNAVKNAEIARQPAFTVRDVLKAAGVAEGNIEPKKPEQLHVAGSNAESRRVEVTLQSARTQPSVATLREQFSTQLVTWTTQKPDCASYHSACN